MQVAILPVSDKFSDYGKIVFDALKAASIRAELSPANESLGKRIREAETMKVPYVLVVGEKEESAGTVAVRRRGAEGEPAIDEGAMDLAKFIEKITIEIKEKRLHG